MRIDENPTASSLNVLTGPFDATLPQQVDLLDTTLREGEQPPGVVFTLDLKLEIAAALDRLGVPWVSIGFPAVSAGEREACERLIRADFGFKTAALARLIPGDIDAAAEVGVNLISLFLGGSDSHLFHKLRLDEDRGVETIQRAVSHAVATGVEVVAFGVEDFSRTPLPRLLRFLGAAVDAGARQITLPDTLGVLTPTSTRRLVRLLRAAVPVPLALHFHNDFGLALANSLAGLEAGATTVHATVNGVGERAGNTCLEELAVLLTVKYGLDLGLRLETLPELTELVHRANHTRPGHHKPVSGRWCFTHEAGIHVAGMLADPETYQPYPPSVVGREHQIVFGKHSGIQGVLRLAEQHGLDLPEAHRPEILRRIKQAAEDEAGPVNEERILRWIREVAGPGPGAS